MARTSKYLNKEFDNGWRCVHVGIAKVQPKRKQDRSLSKNPGRQSYYYDLERPTSDGKATKHIRLNCKEAAKVYRGAVTVEELLDIREAKRESEFTKRVNYHFN